MDRVKERSSTTTSTTTTLLPCIDPDGGVDPDVRSVNVSGYFLYNHTIIADTSEFCQDGEKAVEYYCESGPGENDLKSLIIECKGMCEVGRCCMTEGSVCNGDKDCCTGKCQTMGMIHYCINN
jgi:hypothetical protein